MLHCPHLLLHAMLWPHAAAAVAVQQLISISYLPGPQQQTRRSGVRQLDGTDRQTQDSFFDPAAHCCVGSANNR